MSEESRTTECYNCHEEGHLSIRCSYPARSPRCDLCLRVGRHRDHCLRHPQQRVAVATPRPVFTIGNNPLVLRVKFDELISAKLRAGPEILPMSRAFGSDIHMLEYGLKLTIPSRSVLELRGVVLKEVDIVVLLNCNVVAKIYLAPHELILNNVYVVRGTDLAIVQEHVSKRLVMSRFIVELVRCTRGLNNIKIEYAGGEYRMDFSKKKHGVVNLKWMLAAPEKLQRSHENIV